MTALLQRAFDEAAKLSEPEQEVLASRLLAELAEEDEFDKVIERTADKLAGLANAAREEHRSGRTEALTDDHFK